MKRILSVFLIAAMLLSFGAVSAFAADSVTNDAEDYSDNLVVYYDFEPSQGGKLKDKAPAGQYADDLTEKQSETAKLSYSDGKVTIPKEKDAYIYRPADNTGDDFSSISTEMTVGIKVNISATDSGNTFVISRGKTFNILANKVRNTDTYTLTYRQESKNTATYFFDFEKTKFTLGRDYYIFVTVEKNKNENSTHIIGYWSDDNGVTFNKTENTALPLETTDGNIFTWDDQPLALGAANATKVSDTYSDITFDDVWIFNTAVSAESLPVIIKNRFNYADNGETTAAPTFRGTQTSPVAAGTHKVRFVGTVDSLDYAKVGFKVQITDYDGKQSYEAKEYWTTTVYEEILGQKGENLISYTAGDLGGEYIFALSMEGFPADGKQITVEVTPCYVTLDNQTLYGEAYTVVMTNGSVTSQTAVQ